MDNLYLFPPWGLYVTVYFLVVLLFLLLLRICSSPRGLVTLLLLVSPYGRGGRSFCLVPLFLPCLFRRRSFCYFLPLDPLV